jgi:hypothetical protein
MSYVDELRERCFYYRDHCIKAYKTLEDRYACRQSSTSEFEKTYIDYARSLNIRWCKPELQQAYYEEAIEKLVDAVNYIEGKIREFENSMAGYIFCPYIPLMVSDKIFDISSIYQPYQPFRIPDLKGVIITGT